MSTKELTEEVLDMLPKQIQSKVRLVCSEDDHIKAIDLLNTYEHLGLDRFKLYIGELLAYQKRGVEYREYYFTYSIFNSDERIATHKRYTEEIKIHEIEMKNISCKYCGYKKLENITSQTRGLDEGANSMFKCLNPICGKITFTRG